LYVPGGSLQWEDKGSDFVLGLRIGIGLDSIPAQSWTVEILQVVRDSSGATKPEFGAYQVQVRGWLLANPSVMISYLDTIDFKLTANAFYFPDRYRETRTGLSMDYLVPRDSVFAFHPKTERHAVGEKLSLRVDRYVMQQGTPQGAITMSSLPKMDSLTILANDSLAIASTDTSYTAAIPGQYGFITLLLTAYGATADTVPLFGIEYQVKAAGGSWAGPIDYYAYTAFPLIDSLAVAHGATKAYWPTTTPADSIRFRLINKSIKGRSVVNKLKALWRD
jgi:hypothetical protein